MSDEIDPLFEVHRLNAIGMNRAKSLAVSFTELLRYIETAAGAEPGAAGTPYPPAVAGSRDLAIARTKLQEACFYAKRAMALNPANQEE